MKKHGEKITLGTPGRMVACLLCHRGLALRKVLHGIALVGPCLVTSSVPVTGREDGSFKRSLIPRVFQERYTYIDA